MTIKKFISPNFGMYSMAISTKLNEDKKIKLREKSILRTVTPSNEKMETGKG